MSYQVKSIQTLSCSIDSLEDKAQTLSFSANSFKKRSTKSSKMGSLVKGAMKSSSRGVSSFLGGLGSLFGGSAEPAASAAGSACATRSTRRVDESRSAGR